MTRAVIMAGGEGTRLRPFTHSIPKPLLPIGRKPIAQIIVERLRDCSIPRITMAVNYGADLVRAYFGNGSQFGVQIDYYHEPRKLGTAGALAHIDGLDDAPFLVTNGDILTGLDYGAFLAGHGASGAAMTVATRQDAMTIPYGVLKFAENGLIAGVDEKPRTDYTFSAGVYAISPGAVAAIPTKGPFDMTDLINRLVGEGAVVRNHAVEALWFDLANVDDFEKALAELERQDPAFYHDVTHHG